MESNAANLSRVSSTSTTNTHTRHWINSVSDIYGPDEIEDLLDDLNRLELSTAVERFEVDGSQTGVDSLESPTHSWDSHPNNGFVLHTCNNNNNNNNHNRTRVSVPVNNSNNNNNNNNNSSNCGRNSALRRRHLWSAILLRIFLLMSCVACLVFSVWLHICSSSHSSSSFLSNLSSVMVFRSWLFVSLFSLLVYALTLTLVICSSLDQMLPFNLAFAESCLSLVLTLIFGLGSIFELFLALLILDDGDDFADYQCLLPLLVHSLSLMSICPLCLSVAILNRRRPKKTRANGARTAILMRPIQARNDNNGAP